MEKKHRKKHRKSQLQIYLEYIPFFCVFKLLRLLPIKAATGLAHGLARLIFLVDRKHRRRAMQHLMHAGVAKTPEEARRLARECFKQFGQLIVEILKVDQLLKPERIEEQVKVRFLKPEYEAPFRSVCDGPLIVITAHYGNWEMSAIAYNYEFKRGLVSIGRPLTNPLISQLIFAKRTGADHASYPKEGGIKHLLRGLKEGKSVAIVADQHAGSLEGVEVSFFGQPCRAHASPALLHLKTGVPIVTAVARRLDNHFNFEWMVAKPIIHYQSTGDKQQDIVNITQLYTSALEELIRECPEQWLWLHRRWLNINRKKPVNQGE